MKLYTISDNGKERAGVLRDNKIHLFKGEVKIADIISYGMDKYEIESDGISIDEADILAPIPEPAQDII